MKCIDNELLQCFHDGECLHEEAQRVGLHMSTCPDCRQRYEQLQSRVKAIKSSLNRLCPEAIEIPPVKLHESAREHISFRRKYLLPLLAAASLLLFILVFNKKEKNNISGDQMLHTCFISELDANKPIDEQEFSFTVISPDGIVSEHIAR